LPELEVLDGAGLPLPPAALPPRQPLGDALHEVLAVGHELDHAGSTKRAEKLDGAAERHPVVRRAPLGDPVVPPLPRSVPPDLDQPARAARVRPVLELVAEARFVGMYVQRIQGRSPGSGAEEDRAAPS